MIEQLKDSTLKHSALKLKANHSGCHCQRRLLLKVHTLAKLLSHLSEHVVNRLLHETWKTISKFLNGKKFFKKYNPPNFTFYSSKLTDKHFPHMV